MEEFFWILFNVPLLLIILVILVTTVTVLKKNVANLRRSASFTVSSDGHLVDPSEDLTCEKEYGHNHQTEGRRYIVHQEATDGYVVLNGVKRKISDCKNL